MGGTTASQQILNNGFGAMTNFALVPIPMFLLMGELFYHTGLAARMFNAIDRLIGNVRAASPTSRSSAAPASPALSGSSMGVDRAPRLADGAGDDAARLQQVPVHRDRSWASAASP